MAKKKPSKDKRSRISLRVDPKIHARICVVARALNLDVNGVVCFMLSRWLGQLELEARVYERFGGQDTDSQFEDMEEWINAEPGRTRKQYILDLFECLMNEESDPSRRNRLPNLDGPVTVPNGPTGGPGAEAQQTSCPKNE